MTVPSDRVALIDGCSSVIGRALVEAFRDRGDRVVGTGFTKAARRGLVRERDPASLYRDLVAGMEQRARMSENLAMPADAFARKVVHAVSGPKPPTVVKLGLGARLVSALAMLPKTTLARVLGKKFGLA